MERTHANVRFLDQDPAQIAAWEHDRQLRRRVPPREAYRGCMGLAMLYRNAEHAINHGDACLLPNDHVRWLALRDVPPGHFPTSPPMNRRGVHLVTATVARLRYGMPAIDFTDAPRDTWDWGFRPFSTARRQYGPKRWQYYDVQAAGDTLHAGQNARELAILNQLSAAMTRFAFYTFDPDGRPVRPAWWAARPRDGTRAQTVVSPLDWFPRPYLAFREADAERLFLTMVQAGTGAEVLRCERCDRDVELDVFVAGWTRLKVESAGSGNWLARCPACGQRQIWLRADAVLVRSNPGMPISVKKGFTDALAAGLPLVTTGPCVYGGVRGCSGGSEGRPSVSEAATRLGHFSAHQFRSAVTGEHWLVHLPRTARVQVRPGDRLPGGMMWAHGLASEPSAAWRAQERVKRWKGRAEACGGSGPVEVLLNAWLRHQAIRNQDAPGLLLMPANLVAWGARDVAPMGLFWDVSSTTPFDVADLEAAIFPPLRACRWDRLRFRLPGDVDLDGSIIDPRYRMTDGVTPRLSLVAGSARRVIRGSGGHDGVDARTPAKRCRAAS